MLLLLLTTAFAQERADHPGRWYAERDRRVEQLWALGYVGGYEPVRGAGGVVTTSPDARPGFVLYSSGHRPEALLVDRSGAVRHRWHLPFVDAFPDAPPSTSTHVSAGAWRAVELLPDGGLLGVHEGLGIVALGPDGQRRWAHLDGAHHDLFLEPDGSVWTLTRRLQERGGAPVLEDHLTLRGPDGALREEHSVLAALAASPWADWIDPTVEGLDGDLLHTNSLHRLAGAAYHEAFQPGRFLLSLRHLDALVVYDVDAERIVWASRGPWARQHDAQQGPSGRLWLFDNRGAGDERSRVLALDPSEPARVVRSWGADEGLHSHVLGAVQELPGGHLLITESTAGRCVEVDGEGRVVWAYVNPETARVGGEDLRAAIFACRWLAPDDPALRALDQRAPASTKPL